jgi:hypothetical protein
MEHLSKSERRKLKKQRRKERLAMEMKSESRRNAKKNIKTYGLVVVVIIALGYLGILVTSAPGSYDDFADCLTEDGVVVYGNDWCTYTKQQMAPFGNSFSKLKYVRCDDNKQLCDQKGVSITPTWEISGKIYSGIQSFQTLGELSGCEL